MSNLRRQNLVELFIHWQRIGIQPWYGELPSERRNSVSADYALASLALSGTALGTIGMNIVRPTRLSGFVGFVAGAAAMVIGVNGLGESRGTRRVAAANTGVGVLAMAMSFRGILR